MSSLLHLALTQGDPDGIGPEILVKSLVACAADFATAPVVTPIVLGERDLLVATAERLSLPLDAQLAPAPESGRAATLWALEEACRRANDGRVHGIVTAPIHKADLEKLGFAFPGHTEFLADRLGAGTPTMMLAGDSLRVALVTTHLRLSEVPAAVTFDSVAATLRRVDHGLRTWFGIDAPRIGVLGLNPHAGEDGLFGSEEQEHIAPAVAACRAAGINCEGPLAGDGTFAPHARRRFDGIVAMYHDQGLAALKAVEGGRAVNLTLGLPVPRTSPDHGTARDLVGTGRADPASMIAAIRLALRAVRSTPP